MFSALNKSLILLKGIMWGDFMLFCSNLLNESLFLKVSVDKVSVNAICYVINLFCQVKSIRNPSTTTTNTSDSPRAKLNLESVM